MKFKNEKRLPDPQIIKGEVPLSQKEIKTFTNVVTGDMVIWIFGSTPMETTIGTVNLRPINHS